MARKKAAKKSSTKLKLAAGVAAATIAATALISFTLSSKPVEIPIYSAVRVVDGDTFVTAEKQNIRLAGVQAPELDQCGGPESKRALEKLVLKKPIYLKVTFRDPFNRLVSQVYVNGKYVNSEMLKNGNGYIKSTTPGQDLTSFSDEAKKKKLGIFSSKCTQLVNPKNSACTIKGNDRNGKIYYTPSCGVYPNVSVQLYLGDQWFCSEKAAQKAGFRKPSQCP